MLLDVFHFGEHFGGGNAFGQGSIFGEAMRLLILIDALQAGSSPGSATSMRASGSTAPRRPGRCRGRRPSRGDRRRARGPRPFAGPLAPGSRGVRCGAAAARGRGRDPTALAADRSAAAHPRSPDPVPGGADRGVRRGLREHRVGDRRLPPAGHREPARRVDRRSPSQAALGDGTGLPRRAAAGSPGARPGGFGTGCGPGRIRRRPRDGDALAVGVEARMGRDPLRGARCAAREPGPAA